MSADHLDDTALSAYLDGEASAEERAHVEACGACRGRTEEFRLVARLVASPVASPPPGAIDAAIARAVAAAPVARLDQARSLRARRLMAAAAAAVLLLAGAGVVTSLTGDDDPDEVAARLDAGDESGGSGLADLGPLDLGALNSEEELRQTVSARLDLPPPEGLEAAGDDRQAQAPMSAEADTGAATESFGPPPAADACQAALAGLGQGSIQVMLATLSWQDRPAVLGAYRGDDGDVSIWVLAADTCQPLTFQRISA